MDCFLTEEVAKNGFSIAIVRLLEVGEMGTLHDSVLPCNEAFSTLGTGIDASLFSLVYMEDISFFVVSDSM